VEGKSLLKIQKAQANAVDSLRTHEKIKIVAGGDQV